MDSPQQFRLLSNHFGACFARYDERAALDQQRRHLERQMLAATIHRGDRYSPSCYPPRQPGVQLGPGGLHYPAAPAGSSRLPLMAAPTPTQPGSLRRPVTASRSDERDDAYRERRRKNNEAAKRSRDTRRFKEMQVSQPPCICRA